MEEANGVVQYLLAHPLYLMPILLMVALVVYAILKKLLKIAAIVAIAGAMYIVLVEYFGPGV